MTDPYLPPPAGVPITAQQLAYILFGNPINLQDKGIIGLMQDQVRYLIRLGWALLFTFVAALATGLADLIVNHHW